MVSDIEMWLAPLLWDRENLERLLCLEKQRRGVSKDTLVFIGMANVAKYYWCAMKSLYKNRARELDFFASYLHDRISYSFQLGLIKDLPQDPKKILDIGDEIGFDDIERLLVERITKKFSISLKEIDLWEQLTEDEKKAWVSGLDEASPADWGELFESFKAEQYPTIRWNFAWDKYVVVGVPDGITKEFVYEFKATKSRFLMNFLKPVAFTQADLYGYFFRRSKKRVQIYISKEGKVETWEAPVDVERAKDVLTKFKEVDIGFIPPPPKDWKCKSCEFAKSCILRSG